MSVFTLISSLISTVPYLVAIVAWDLLLVLGNIILPNRPVGKVTLKGRPGFAGNWPEYRVPQKGDSRSACPGLNALANHGIIPRNGKGLTFPELDRQVRATYNLSSTLSSAIGHFASNMLKKKYTKDTFDLDELSLHNGIEHDASLTRLDIALHPDQSSPHLPFVEELFLFATGKGTSGNQVFTLKDLSRVQGKRRVECKATNTAYNLDLTHKLFGSANSSFLWSVFGGRVDDLRTVLLEERLPDGWESRIRNPFGLTITVHNSLGIQVESGVREADWKVNTEPAAVSSTSQAVLVNI